MSRMTLVVNEVTFHYGWDNPMQEFFLQRENDDPCENCNKDFNSGMCPKLCPGHGYQDIETLIGAGGYVRAFTPEEFEEALQGYVSTATPGYSEIVRNAKADYETRRPLTSLQQVIQNLFKEVV